jgi:hypothetical protein
MRHIDHVILERAKQLVEQGWVKGRQAETQWGANCSPLSEEAVRFCMGGAVVRAAADIFGATDLKRIRNAEARVRRLLKAANSEIGFGILNPNTIERFNDRATKKEVLAAFDEALKV